MDPVRRLADAVLYEGYILWPYRRSALKNQKRWTFGGVHPPRHSDAHPDDRAELQAQCLLEADAGAVVEVTVRFLQVVERRTAQRRGDRLVPVDELTAAGTRYLSWDEAVEREILLRLEVGPEAAHQPILIPGRTEEEVLGEEGALVRSWQELSGSADVRVEPLGERLHRLTLTVRNETPWHGSDRDDALRHTFCSTHAVLQAERGAFVSLTDPPDELREQAEACVNVGVWPVLVGSGGERDTMLASPIILSDYAEIAPESPGDLFDSGEIDRLLILNVLSLTEAEQAEMSATDDRTREILERCAALGPPELLPLHGAIREFRPAETE
jgi:hypothetical protein